MRCSACGTTALREAARFCDTCGAPLEHAEPVVQLTEYKQVTVLFADVVRSMDIAAALGPERLRELMTELVKRSATVVQRYGGSVNQFTGDGFMALFGAPIAMEDHALRACIAALHIQSEARTLAADVQRLDGISLRLRIGLNSGEVVAGDIGAGPMQYIVSGQQVGMAQRMESAAPPGGVMLSESTSRLVEDSARLGEAQLVAIKGASEPVSARELLAAGEHHVPDRRRETTLVGREREITLLGGALDQAISRQGRVVCVKGPPGIGKSRISREAAAIAEGRGLDVIATYCESHSAQIPFHAVAGLLRGFFGVGGLDHAQATARVRAILPDADVDDLVLLDDLLGIGYGQSSDGIDPDARRRRLSTLLDAALLARPDPALYIIDDAQWIDGVSESMLAEFIAAAPRTHAPGLDYPSPGIFWGPFPGARQYDGLPWPA